MVVWGAAETAETKVLAREETARGELALRMRKGAEGPAVYEVIFNGVFLMASTNAFSARQLAHLALQARQDRLAAPSPGRLRVLIGGLGMGYTLQAVLEHPEVRRVEVVEVEPLMVDWARRYFGPLSGNALKDQRVRVVLADLAQYVQEARGPYDAILLDIDNGPSWLVLEENAALYSEAALERMRALLAPGGVLAVWAAASAPDFLTHLERVFDWADEVSVVEEVEGRCTEYYIYRGGAG